MDNELAFVFQFKVFVLETFTVNTLASRSVVSGKVCRKKYCSKINYARKNIPFVCWIVLSKLLHLWNTYHHLDT